MFKVLIVDDEIYVVALIKKLIEWERFDMSIVATANDGISALELVKEMTPDLVILDVRMPGYDGISFMDKVREFNQEVRFIVISGHKQFDYAVGAVRNNVEDYLLKPINKSELEKVIGRVQQKLIENRKQEEYVQTIRAQLDNSKQRMKKALLEKILEEPKEIQTLSCQDLNAQYFTKFDAGSYQMMAFAFDAPAGLSMEDHQNELKDGILKDLISGYEEICIEFVHSTCKNITVFLLNYLPEKEEELKLFWDSQIKKHADKIGKFNNTYFSFIIGKAKTSIAEAADELPEMKNGLVARGVWREKHLIEICHLPQTRIKRQSVLSLYEQEFSDALKELKQAEMNQCIRLTFSKAFYQVDEDYLIYYELFMELARKIYMYFHNIDILHETEEEYLLKMQMQFLCHNNVTAYRNILIHEVEQLIEHNKLSATSASPSVIRVSKHYISEHYMEDLSLTSVADVVNISPVYLSRLFKKEEGINFLDYVNQYRITISKDLLKNVQYNVSEIAEMCGFGNARSFAKIFKKNMGITPTDYRKRHCDHIEG